MDVNKEAIFGTRPFKVFGEGPASDGAPISAQGFNEGKGKPMTSDDVRFTTKRDVLYAIVMGNPTSQVSIKSLGKSAQLLDGTITSVQMLGSDQKLDWSRSAESLHITPPKVAPSDAAVVLKITLGGAHSTPASR
jgi:alpha-L-fucosidase